MSKDNIGGVTINHKEDEFTLREPGATDEDVIIMEDYGGPHQVDEKIKVSHLINRSGNLQASNNSLFKRASQ